MGKSLQPLNAIAVRQPNTTPAAGPAAAAPAAPNEPVTAESLGWQLRAALPPLRLHSVSIYDEQANVLWLSEGALGPDEHNVVVEAIDALRGDATLTFYETGLGDGRVALFLPVRAPQGGLVGLAMILADIKSVGDGVIERMVTPQVRTIMQKVAVLLRPAGQRSGQTEAVKILELSEDPTEPPPAQATAKAAPAAPALTLASSATPTPAPAPARGATNAPASAPRAKTAAPSTLSPQAVDDILEFEMTPEVSAPAVRPQSAQLPSPPKTNGADLSLDFPSDKPAAKPSGAAASVSAIPTLGVAGASTSSPSASIPTASAATPAENGTAAPQGAAIPTTAATGTAKALAATTGTSKALSATSTMRTLALPEGVELILEVQPYTKLRAGGRTRRYEVIARSSQPNRTPSGFDKIALQQLLTWMGANRAAWNLEPTSFTLNLSIATLEDERFPQFVASHLKANGIAPDNIGFEIAEPLCLQRRAQVERFITLCDKLGCFVVIDDFSLDSSIVSLLRSKALRLVKIDPKLTSVALKDKLAQAMVVAIAQAVKVLGIHVAAKRVDSQASLQWLTAIGCDLAQGPALAPLTPLESLAGQPPPPTRSN